MSSSTFSSLSFNEAINDFSLTFYNEIGKTDNVCISPFSVAATLLLVMLGTENQSKRQVEHVLFRKGIPFGNLNREYKDLYKSLVRQSKRQDGIQLKVSNQFFVETQQVNRIRYKFSREAERNYECLVGLVDFGDEPYTRDIINAWIESKTEQKIKNLIPDGMINEKTFMIMTNAIYFKGQWQRMFNPALTRERPFWVNKKDKILAPMMYRKFKVKAGEVPNMNCKIAEIPYVGGNFSMVVVLPNEKDGLVDLERQLSLTTMNNLYKQLTTERETEVMLPKFKVKSSLDLKSILLRLNMTDVFSADKADFARMVRQNDLYGPLYVSDALHESIMEVNEEGSEAAAVTSILISFRSASVEAFKFHADHPFLYFIREISTGAIIFIGRYSNPAVKKSPIIKDISLFDIMKSSRIVHIENSTDLIDGTTEELLRNSSDSSESLNTTSNVDHSVHQEANINIGSSSYASASSSLTVTDTTQRYSDANVAKDVHVYNELNANVSASSSINSTGSEYGSYN